jgi:hypothetical protein
MNLNTHNLKHHQFAKKSVFAIIALLLMSTIYAVVLQYPSRFQAQASFVSLPPISLTVVGFDGTQVVLNETDIGNLTSYRAYGGYKNSLGNLKGLGNYTGVPINTFCEMVGGIHYGYNVYIIASDGYSKIMSYAQVNGDFVTYDNVTGEEVQHNQTLTPILAYHYNDLNLSSSDGPLRAAIVSPEGLCTGSTYWVKQVVRLEIHANLQPMNLTIVAPNGTELTLDETEISVLPALRDVGARRNSIGVVSGLGNYTGSSLNMFCDLVGGMENDTVLLVTAADNTTKKLTYEEVNGAFTTYNMSGQPVSHNESLTPILAYHFNDANLSLTDGPLRLAIVGSEGLATTSSYWVKQVVKLEIQYLNDIALTNVKLSKIILGLGYSVSINVTVTNQGDQAEAFNVTLYANTTIIGISEVSLSSGSSTTITFTWNTTGFAKGNYTISAYAWPVLNETDIDDNTYTNGTITVTIPGDVDGDFDVDLYDAVGLLVHYGAKTGQPAYNPVCDIDGDGDIDLYDAVTLLTHYGQKYP